jgi:hypothetical protein
MMKLGGVKGARNRLGGDKRCAFVLKSELLPELRVSGSSRRSPAQVSLQCGMRFSRECGSPPRLSVRAVLREQPHYVKHTGCQQGAPLDCSAPCSIVFL